MMPYENREHCRLMALVRVGCVVHENDVLVDRQINHRHYRPISRSL
ncbi:MAG: hypothetical protein ACKESC_01520 [Candidatus Hodgkinia cicadicola]